MEYRASWRNTSGFGVLCILGATVCAAFGAWTSTPAVLAVGVALMVYLYAIGRRLLARIDEDRLGYRGWRGTNDVKWTDVVSITRADNLSYPRDRYYGPSCYEVRTNSACFIVNLLYFPPEFARAFDAHAKRFGLLRRRRPKG